MKKVYVFAVLASAFLASCTNEETATSPASKTNTELGVAVTISSKESTRAAATGSLDGTAFADGKQIGVFVTGVGYTSKIAPYTLSGTTWNAPTLDADKIFLSGNIATVYGFYPYDANTDITLSTLSLSASVPTAYTNFDASECVDYMYATKAGATDGSHSTASNLDLTGGSYKANLAFNHALSKITFVINKASTYPAGTAAGILSQLVLKATSGTPFVTKGAFDLSTGAFTASTTASDLVSTITLHPATSTNYKNINEYNATALTTPVATTLAAPCSFLAGTVNLELTIDGRVMTASMPASTWLSGKNYIYTVTVAGTSLVVESVAINAWTVGTNTSMGTVQ
jgi:hypothetical protein